MAPVRGASAYSHLHANTADAASRISPIDTGAPLAL